MAELKTQKNDASVHDFISSIEDEAKKTRLLNSLRNIQRVYW